MRSTMISMFIVLVISAAVCTTSMIVQFRVLNDIDAMCTEMINMIRKEDIEGALKYADDLKSKMEKSSGFMEVIASHDQLHEAMTSIADAQVALECDDLDDAYQALARLRGTVEHLREHERLSISNLC